MGAARRPHLAVMPTSEMTKCPLCGVSVRIVRRANGAADHYEALTKDELDAVPVPISPVLDQFLRAQRKGKRTVAIVGAGWTSRAWAPYQEEDVEVWSFNELHGRTGIGKATRWFQLHPRWDFEKDHKHNHREWLAQKHDFPIYMQQAYDGIPNAVRYPLVEIQNKLLGNIWKGELQLGRIFGSTLAYALALALYEDRFDRIELFGIEMVLDGEWAYQRESAAFWLGKASGMGIEVWMPEACQLFKMPLYAYEEIRRGDGSVLVPPEGVAVPFHPPTRLPSCPKTISGIHEGKAGVVIGNGPSLGKVPRGLLERYPTFGANHVYLLPLQPTYYVLIDSHILENMAAHVYDVAAGAEIAFLSDKYRERDLPATQRLYALPNAFLVEWQKAFPFPGETYWMGSSTVYGSLKIAYAMGFQTILLVGVDHGRDHFSGDYTVDPNPERSFDILGVQKEHYRVANDVYKSAGRRIVNLSAPSDLDEILERGEIGDWM